MTDDVDDSPTPICPTRNSPTANHDTALLAHNFQSLQLFPQCQHLSCISTLLHHLTAQHHIWIISFSLSPFDSSQSSILYKLTSLLSHHAPPSSPRSRISTCQSRLSSFANHPRKSSQHLSSEDVSDQRTTIMMTFRHPTTILIPGPTQTGKTFFLKQVLEIELFQPSRSCLSCVSAEHAADLEI